ncbi:MAG: quinol oxidase [Ignavibacteriales bacterium]
MIKKILSTEPLFFDLGLLIARIWLGVTFIVFHGYRKITNPEGWEKLGTSMASLGVDFAPAFWGFMAAFTESFGALFLLLGFFTRPFSALLAFTMFIATLKHLLADEKFSYPLEMMAVFTLFAFLGAGKYSLDKLITDRG